jgi:hypothetical protein
MADPKTWIDVADDAVKIGLGALLGGSFAVLVARLNNRSQIARSLLEKRREIIESVLTDIDSFTTAASVYWANLSNAVFKRDQKEFLSPEDLGQLKELEQALFESFTISGRCSARLLLIGEREAAKKLRDLRGTVDGFFRIGNIRSDSCTASALEEHKKLMLQERDGFLLALSKSFEREA